MKYRKRPIVVEARKATEREEIHTLEGTLTANPGDWIITGIKGEEYPCRADIFEATYEEVSGETPLGKNSVILKSMLSYKWVTIGINVLIAGILYSNNDRLYILNGSVAVLLILYYDYIQRWALSRSDQNE